MDVGNSKRRVAATTMLIVLAACGNDGPSPDNIKTALNSRAKQAMLGCPMYQYSGIEKHSESAPDDQSGVYALKVSYDFKSFAYGHSDQEFERLNKAGKLPDWFPQACVAFMKKLQSGDYTPAQLQRGDRILRSEFHNAGDSVDSEESLQAFSEGKKVLHIARTTLHLKQSDSGWRVVDE